VRVLWAVALLTAAAIAGPVAAQEVTSRVPTTESRGAILRGLDKMTGETQDIDINDGQTKRFDRLEISLGDCRYPTENPAGNAYAYLTIRDIREELPRFQGWMIAASPALSALDHPRDDVWVLHCKLPAAKAAQ